MGVSADDGGGGQAVGRWLAALALAAVLAGGGWLVSELRAQRAALAALRAQVAALAVTQQEFAPDPAWAGGTTTAPSTTAAAPTRQAPGWLAQGAPAPAQGATGGAAERVREVRDTPALREALVELLDSDDPKVKEKLQQAVQAQEEARRDEMRDARAARWEERTVSRISELAGKVQLDQGQQDALYAILARNRDRAGEAFRAAREDRSFGEAREKVQAFRTEADAEARELLSDTQYEAYVKMRDEEAQRRGFRRRQPDQAQAR